MSKNNKALVAAKKTVESLRKLSAEAYNNYTESGDRYHLGKCQAYDIAANLLEINMPIETMPQKSKDSKD